MSLVFNGVPSHASILNTPAPIGCSVEHLYLSGPATYESDLLGRIANKAPCLIQGDALAIEKDVLKREHFVGVIGWKMFGWV